MLDKSVSGASLGGNHSYVWKRNEVYCWGSNDSYELGFENGKEFEITKPDFF